MSAYRKAKNSDSAVGWISMTDLFLLVSILLLCSYASLTSDYRKVQSVADDQEKSLTVLQKDCASLRLAWEESEAKSVEMEKTYAMNIALREQKLQTSMNRQIELIQMKEVGVRKEILGLKGKMERTLFLFDRSQSMETEIANAKIDRWKHAQEILRTWLLYLPVRECAVITFNETLDGYPPRPGQYLKMTGVEGETNRQELLRWLTSITPEGNTNTEVALQLAYRYQGVSAIFLFTDGAPNIHKGEICSEKTCCVAILELATNHKNIPINVIGLGDYFLEGGRAAFLIRLAKLTGGSFRGR